MNSYLENSLIYRTVKLLHSAYQNSVFHKAVSVIGLWHEYSFVHKLSVRYVSKESTAKHTITYKTLAAVGSKADSGVGRISRLFTGYIQGSRVFQLLDTAVLESGHYLYRMVVTLLITFAGGYAFASILKKSLTLHKLLLILAVIVLSAVLLFIKDQWKRWIRCSLIFRFFQYILNEK